MSHASHLEASGPTYLWLVTVPLALFLLLAWGLASHPLPWRVDVPWIPSLGISLAFRIDGLSAQLLALITGIGAWIFVYASGHLAHDPQRGRLFAVLVLFMLAMIGAVTADNLIVLFLFWELTSMTSFLLGGLVLLARMAGAWTLSGIVSVGPTLVDDPRLPYALTLVLLGAFTKSAQFAFHFWLPNAMTDWLDISGPSHERQAVVEPYLRCSARAPFGSTSRRSPSQVSGDMYRGTG